MNLKLQRPGRMVLSASLALFAGFFLQVPSASAVPSYARQTGYPCKACHYMPPELTPLGRAFKLAGYTLAGKPTVTSKGTKRDSGLDILESFPLSVIFDTSLTATRTVQPGAQNGNFQFPQDASLFLAGAWAPHVGSFVQVTYDTQADHFSWDNTDIRYANSTKLFKKDLAYGITLNNNPTVEDLWNSTPAWGFPSISSSSAPGPDAGALINGGLAQDVAGLGGYAMWNNHLYIAGTLYRSEHIGAPQPNTGRDASDAPLSFNIRGVAPYWRVAWQETSKNNNFEIGSYGMHVKSYPGAIAGLDDSYTDWAFDFQYDRTIPQFGGDVVSFRGTYIRENSALVATGALTTDPLIRHHLNTIQANAEYHFGNKLSGTIGYFDVDGTPDPVLFASANGDPRSNGYIANVSWWPVQNIGLTFQYTGYSRFNGAATNYDGSGRNASSNNTAYLVARFVF
ncbi:MAG TPA: hypothetical protein VKT71_10675 [Candidatus Acidoferrales bacterium]|nr:hypothetical protein [Candidatus Acidoferrales bacterium]